MNDRIQYIEKINGKFKAKIDGRVKFEDVDAFGVVYNIKYHYWLEWARTEYFRQIGLEINESTFTKENVFMVVRVEVDFIGAARFSDEYEILSRVAKIGDSSVVFENIVRLKNGAPLAFAKAIFSHINPKTLRPERVPNNIRNLVSSFEGGDAEIAA